ncbi:carbon-nitrogen hydrolase family protein [Scandinavium sp. H11S7]|uniref:Carbon-nitrogen hydrolase family protein n=1 Tax=Scandinavium hiltneri TaxID=2926519 RepID=A0ABT2E2V8_9ENTR|nr:nitrilase-related carbon-nitrogen hydrolase [Scandinavium hiltneri]MCS2161340.1 carbon-nitrogen hydrolase family protein [Scandinavium hiltneri]
MPAWTIAAAQYTARNRSVAENIDHHLCFIEAAAKLTCQLIVFPEMSLTGPDTDYPLSPIPTDELLQPLCVAAKRHGMTIIAGLPVDMNGDCQKGVAIFVPGASSPLTMHQGQGTCLTPQTLHISVLAPEADAIELDPNATLLATGTCTCEFQQQQSVQQLQRLAHRYAIAVLKSNYAVGSALWDENGQLIVRADSGDLLLTGRKYEGGWEGDIIPLRESLCAIDESLCGA